MLEWLAVEGAFVSPGQVLFTVETDKAAIEVPAEESGVLIEDPGPSRRNSTGRLDSGVHRRAR